MTIQNLVTTTAIGFHSYSLEWWGLKIPSPTIPAPELAGRGRLDPLCFFGLIEVIAHHGYTISEGCDIFKCILKRVLIRTSVRARPATLRDRRERFDY